MNTAWYLLYAESEKKSHRNRVESCCWGWGAGEIGKCWE